MSANEYHARFWNSRKFAGIDDEAKLLYLYLLSSPHSNSVGCFVLKNGYATADLGWEVKAYLKAIDSLSKAGLIGYNQEESLVRIVNFLSFEPFTNQKHAMGALKQAYQLPECEQKLFLFKDLSANKHVTEDMLNQYPMDSLSKAYRYMEQEQEQEQDKFVVVNAQEASSSSEEKTEREEILLEIGHDETGSTANGKISGTVSDMAVREKWVNDLGLSQGEILEVIASVRRQKSYPTPPPTAWSYFNQPMEKLAGAKAQKLEPREAKTSPRRGEVSREEITAMAMTGSVRGAF